MYKDLKIKNIKALEVLDSRGNPTIQAEVILEDGYNGVAIIPSGASTGSFEAIELRDNDKKRYNGKGVMEAVNNVNKIISPNLLDMNVYNQTQLDEKLINLDGTDNKKRLGANSILGVSLAIAKAAANSLKMPLYKYIGGINGIQIPIPMMNILNGGKHSENTVNIQEFMIIPQKNKDFSENLEICVKVYKTLKEILNKNSLSTGVGDEGGFAPNLKDDEQALELITEAIEKAGYTPKEDVALALDVASTEMYEKAEKSGKKGNYYFWKTDNLKTTDEMIKYLSNLVDKYPIISIEDGLAEEDWNGWLTLTKQLSDKIQLVGDDLFVTNSQRLKKGINLKVANSILIKPNQIGTLTETLEVIELAKKNGYKTIISHRSGETEDTTIADIAVAVNAGQIKTGAPCRTDRVAKYNRLLNIENYLKMQQDML